MRPFNTAVSAPVLSDTEGTSEESVTKQLQRDEEAARNKALTYDIKANTWLKIGLAIFICLLIIAWIVFLFCEVHNYISKMGGCGKDTPTEVVVALIAAGTSIMGLMGFILKGLFKSS